MDAQLLYLLNNGIKAICHKDHLQVCHMCEDVKCHDNENPLLSTIRQLMSKKMTKDEAATLLEDFERAVRQLMLAESHTGQDMDINKLSTEEADNKLSKIKHKIFEKLILI